MRPLHSRKRRATLSDARRFAKNGVGSEMRAEDYLSDSERYKLVQEAAGQLQEITKRHFPRTGILEYAVLKAHLIIEFALTQFIRCASHVLVDPDDQRFSFAQKLEIAVMLGFAVGCDTTVPSIELLNRIRNQAVHRFQIDRVLVDELIRINSEDLGTAPLTDRHRISCLRYLCCAICNRAAGELQAAIVFTSRNWGRTHA